MGVHLPQTKAEAPDVFADAAELLNQSSVLLAHAPTPGAVGAPPAWTGAVVRVVVEALVRVLMPSISPVWIRILLAVLPIVEDALPGPLKVVIQAILDALNPPRTTPQP